jgi:branched-chain amino acid transport system permease protein
MTSALQILIDAISVGSLYALAALGVGLVFGVLRLVNFAYGDFITVGSYALIVPSASITAIMFIGDWPWPLLVIASAIIVMMVALICDFVVFRPLRQASSAVLMIASFGLSYIIQNAIIIIYNARPKAVGIWPGLAEAITIGDLRVPGLQVVTIVVALGLLAALVLFLRKSRFGVQMRAAAEDFQMARMLGVQANTVIGTAFVISAFLAAIVSLLFLCQVGVVSFHMGTQLMLIAFIATVIGGMGSLVGAVVGGYAIGISGTLLQVMLPENLRYFRDAFVFGAVIVILLARPQGLVVTRAARERV